MNNSGVREFAGLPAAGGSALGPCCRFRYSGAKRSRRQGSVSDESKLLDLALARSSEQIAALVRNSDELGAEILEFQELLLEDDSILDPVRKQIAGGTAADDAWQAVLNSEIEDYASSEGEYMAARATDLTDLRDRVLNAMSEGTDKSGEPRKGDIVVAEDIGPSVLIEWIGADKISGIALSAGSKTAHTAIVARSHGIPMAVGVTGMDELQDRGIVLVDGDNGTVAHGDANELSNLQRDKVARQQEEQAIEAEYSRLKARTRSGRAVKVLINVEDPDALDELNPEICDGVGLFRTEFLFMGGTLPSEEIQYEAYKRMVLWAGGRPVTIRTLDAGGDKPIAGITADGESNPFLGQRGLRLSLANPDQFRMQLRALSRAAALGPVKVMLPMVTIPLELSSAADHLDAVLKELEEEDAQFDRPALGIMVETPAAALTAADWSAEFYSIGSNDLVQYVTACARDNPNLVALASPSNPAVLDLIKRTVDAGRFRGVEVSICGEMASDPKYVHTLLGLGLDTLSVTANYAGRVKHAISTFDDGP